MYLLRALVDDFKGLADTSTEQQRLDAMLRQSDVKKALKTQRDSEDAEARATGELFTLEAQLRDDSRPR